MSRDTKKTHSLEEFTVRYSKSLEKWEWTILENLEWNLQMSTWFEAVANITEQA
jgi:hypothetical protein